MQEGADELWAHVLGGYNDLAQVLAGPIQVLPFLPVLCGEDEKVFMSVYVRPLDTVFALHREHVGRFMPHAGVPGGRGGGGHREENGGEAAGETNAHALQHGYRGRFDRAELLRWCRLAQEVLSKKSVVKADCVSAEALRDYCAAVSSDEAAVERARDLLQQLSAIVADTEAAHSQQTQCEMTYSRCAAELKLFPHHCFEHLADELTHYYVHRHGEYFRAPLALARLLTVPHALPTEYARAVFLPLYLPVFGEKKVVKTFGNGESSEVCVYTLKYKPFCGFGYSVPDANVYEHWTDPEQAPEDYADLRRYLTVDKCVKSHSQRLIARFYKTLQGLREIAKTDDKWLPALRRWTEWDECVHQQHGTFHQRQMRRMFGTELGIAVLQSQVSMGCQPYAAASLACVHQQQQPQTGPEEGQEAEQQQQRLLTTLIKFTRGRVQKTAVMLKANNLNYFTMKDVTSVRMELSGAQSAGIVMHKMNYVPDTQREQTWVKRSFEELRLPYSIASRNAYVPNVLQLGLWSPYNSTECTQWGNFNAKDPNKTGGVVSVQHRETLTELNAQTFKKWQYEFKQLPGSEPGNPLAWVYCARGALFTTLGAFHAYTVDKYGALTTEPKVGDTVQAMVQDLSLHILRGFYHKLRAGPGEYGVTFRETGATNTIRAYAMSSAISKPMDATSLGTLNRLQWTQVGDEDPEKMRYLAATYPLKRLVSQWLRTGEPVYYKRAFYTSPIAATFNESYVLRMRNNFVYAPFAVLTSQNVVMSAIKCVSFSASTTIPWKNVDIYKVILDTNSFYSQEKRAEWDLGGSSSYTGIDGQGNGEADAGEIVRFLTDEYDGQEVPSSALNMYRFPKDKYLSIVHMLKNRSMYYEDVPPVYAPDPLPRGALHRDDDADDADDDASDGGTDVQRQASYALQALENPGFAQKRKVLTRELHADETDDPETSHLSDLERIVLKNSSKRQKLLGSEHV